MFYRPPELDSMCLWDILRNYVKEKKPKSRTQRKTYLEFKRGHPQHATHCLKKLDAPVIPVLMGYHIPRNDSESDRTKYAVVILALLKLWSDTKSSPLKSPEIAWPDALDDFKRSMSPEHARILLNMQLLYQTREAKFDFAAKRSKRLAELRRMAKDTGITGDDEGDEEYDPVWENAMQTALDPEELDADDMGLTKDTGATRDAQQIVLQASNGGFYSVQNMPSSEIRAKFGQRTRLGDEDDIFKASVAAKVLLKEKDLLIKRRLKAAENSGAQNVHHAQASSRIPQALCTNLAEEAKRARELYEKRQIHSESDSHWNSLRPYQQLCLALIVKYTLNDEQARAFLLLADKIGREIETGRKDPPISLLCTGPGGTGKSVIFGAWKEFYEILGHPERLRLTAPTGVVASDIGGCTIHS
jgi:hypothetical protein